MIWANPVPSAATSVPSWITVTSGPHVHAYEPATVTVFGVEVAGERCHCGREIISRDTAVALQRQLWRPPFDASVT